MADERSGSVAAAGPTALPREKAAPAPRWRWRNGSALSLKMLLAIAFGAIAVLAIGTLGIYAGNTIRTETRRHVQRELGELALQMGYRLDRSMFERYRDVQIASSLESLRWTEVQRRMLERLRATYTDYAWIGIADRDGRVLASTDGLLEGENVSQRPWFTGGLEGPFVGDVTDAQLFADLLPNQSGEPLRFVDLAAPIHAADGTLVGVLGVHLNWTWASEVLGSILGHRSAEEAIEVLLLSEEGTVLLGPRDSLGKTSPCPLLPRAVAGQRGDGLATCADGRYVIGFADSQGYRYYPGLGWQVLIRQPIDVALAPIDELRRRLLLAGAGLAAMFMIAGWWFAAWIAQPLRNIALAAVRMRGGERGIGVPTSLRFAEVASLVASLTSLLDDLTRTETELRTTASENERRQRFQAAIVENMQDALYVDRGGRIIFANDACVRLLGAASADEVIGKSPFDVIHPECHALIRERMQALSEPGAQVPTVEEKVIRLDGRTVDVEVTAASFADQGGRAILVILRDITARKLTERQLTHAQRLEAVGHLTGGMAHDFNNLLTIVIGNLDLLEADLHRDPKARQLAAMALNASLRGADLTRQLLAFSRRQSLDPKIFHLNQLVTGTTELLQRTLGEQVKVRLKLADDLWPAVADPAQMESAMANLAINARDAMPDGGVLTIETANQELDEEYASENAEVEAGDYVMLAVSDTGTGIPPEALGQVFEPFFTTKEDGKGSGLGLSMVYGFAKQSRGHVMIDSEPGHGTTVRLYVPRAEMEMPADVDGEPVETASAESAQSAAGVTVLVVEDRAEVRQVVVRQLTELGYRTLEADCGTAALALIDGDPSIGVLFTDVIMPGGMTGVDLAEEARLRRPDLKVVFTSGFADVLDGTLERSKAFGPLLSKPYRRLDLARQIRAAL